MDGNNNYIGVFIMQERYVRLLKALGITLITSLLFFTTGCEDDDHDHDHDEDHTDADGFVIQDENENVLYREFEGDVTGDITLAVGDTLELSVHFLDDEGNEIEHEEEEDHDGHDHDGHDHDEDHDEDGDGDGLAVSGANPNIAIVEVEAHEEEEEEEHDEEDEHGNSFHIVGVSAGSTNFKLQLIHDGHADYTSTTNVNVTVTE
jgi:hypothetical protein